MKANRTIEVGYRSQHPKYGWFEVIAMPKSDRGVIRFDKTGYEYEASKYHILDGYVRDRKHLSFHQVGESYVHPIYGEYHIVELIKGKKAIVEFSNTGFKCEQTINNIRNGKVKDALAPIVCGVGYMGTKRDMILAPSKTPAYFAWHNMISRCYSDDIQNKRPTYRDCFVCEEWKCFSNFREWFDNQVYFFGWKLDKDILVKGNKIYAPNTACFVPNEINVLFTKRQNCRGELPVGVQYSESKLRYKAGFTKGMKKVFLGYYATPEEAFQAYKEAKETWIKEVADKWKDKLDPRVYEAMYNYKVEITD